MEVSWVAFCSATGWLVPYTRCQKYHWVPPGNRTHELTALLLLIMGFCIIAERVTALSWNGRADSNWHCNELCMMFGYPDDFRSLESQWESWAAPLRRVKATAGTLIIFFSFHVDQQMWMVLTDVYIREIIPYAYFFPEDGKEDTEIYVVFGLKKNDKLQCAYSARKNSLSTATLSQGVCPSFWDLPGGVQASLLCNAMDFSRDRTVGARVGLDSAASWLLSSAMLKSAGGLSLSEPPKFPALTESPQHSPTWPFIELFAICLQILIWRDWNGKKCIFGHVSWERGLLGPEEANTTPFCRLFISVYRITVKRNLLM